MSNHLSRMERDINTVVDEYAVDEINRTLINEGKQSILRGKYDLDFDNYSYQWCFRSAKSEELTRPEHFVYRYELGGRNGNVINFIKQVLRDIRSAVNNDIYKKDDYLSYSKNLAAPLFKYHRDSPVLIIDKLGLNSIDIQIGVHCFNWLPTYDSNGDKDSQYYIEDDEFAIPFTELFSNKKMLSLIHEYEELLKELKGGMLDIDDVEVSILELTFDISINSRKNFDKYYKDSGSGYFKRRASYITDGEVLTTRCPPSPQALIIKDSKVLQFVRFIYFVKIGGGDSDKMNSFIDDVIANNLVEIAKLERTEQVAVRWILEYFKNGGSEVERRVYNKIFSTNSYKKSKYPPAPPSCVRHSDSKKLVEFIQEDLKTFRFFEKNFLDKLIPHL